MQPALFLASDKEDDVKTLALKKLLADKQQAKKEAWQHEHKLMGKYKQEEQEKWEWAKAKVK